MKTPEQIREELVEANPEAQLFDGLDKALVGYGQQYSGTQVLAAYDYEMCVAVFVEEGMSYEEAVEWMEFNVACLWCGEGTPLILNGLDEAEAAELVAQR